jgi:hypothetical protein
LSSVRLQRSSQRGRQRWLFELNQTFPAASSTSFLVSLYNQLAFYENEAGGCTI